MAKFRLVRFEFVPTVDWGIIVAFERKVRGGLRSDPYGIRVRRLISGKVEAKRISEARIALHGALNETGLYEDSTALTPKYCVESTWPIQEGANFTPIPCSESSVQSIEPVFTLHDEAIPNDTLVLNVGKERLQWFMPEEHGVNDADNAENLSGNLQCRARRSLPENRVAGNDALKIAYAETVPVLEDVLQRVSVHPSSARRRSGNVSPRAYRVLLADRLPFLAKDGTEPAAASGNGGSELGNPKGRTEGEI